jgi:hypothetical protein
MTLDFCSLNVILFSFVQLDIFLISMLAWFSASRTVSALTAVSKSSAKAIAFVPLLYLRLSSELYWILENPGPQQEPCGHMYECMYIYVCIMYVCMCVCVNVCIIPVCISRQYSRLLYCILKIAP